MEKKFILLILILGTSNLLFCQGFDWQWSPRLPFDNPRLYWGFNASYNVLSASGNISFLENRITCQDFNDGDGYKVNVGGNIEYWDKLNRFAYRAGLNYNINSLNSYSKDFVPISPTLTAEYENKLALNYSFVSINAGAKYQIGRTHINIGADLVLSFIITKNFKVTEEILGPPEMPPFNTNPRSYKRDVLNGEINAMNVIQINPAFTVSYDLQLGLGTYIEPNFIFLAPIRSMFTDNDIANYEFAFGVKFYRKF